VFRGTIEKKAKEEYKKEIDKWLEDLTAKGIAWENYQPPKKQKKQEEAVLKHGVEKNVNIESLTNWERFLFKANTIANELLRSHKKDLYYGAAIFMLFLMMILLISKVNWQSNMLVKTNKNIENLQILLESHLLSQSNQNKCQNFKNFVK
jgi:hypothetical protein